jgi:hypothetical protein
MTGRAFDISINPAPRTASPTQTPHDPLEMSRTERSRYDALERKQPTVRHAMVACVNGDCQGPALN